MSCLSDKAILHAMFNPEMPVSENLAQEEERYETLTDDEPPSELLDEVKALEVQGVKKAESGDLHGAEADFTKAIELMPNRPSAYNNRAQARRLLGAADAARADLDAAISLVGNTPGSCKSNKALGQALCQRGVLRRLAGDDDAAAEDFRRAAELGAPFARQMLVKMNPYAALCNQMLSDIVRKIKDGEA